MKGRIIGICLIASLPVIYWTCSTTHVKRDVLRFSHKRHMDAAECTDCHKGAAKSAAKAALPRMSQCLTCHEDQQDNCKMCHSNPDAAVPVKQEASRFHFSHAKHMKRVKNGCLTCHANISKDLKHRPFTGHQAVVCMKCHVHRQDLARSRCTRCHKDMAKLPPRRVAEYAHRDILITGKHTVAPGGEKTCVQCHDRHFCTDCHAKSTRLKPELKFPQRVGMNLVHRGNYETRHRFDARRNPQSCMKCHSRTYCVDCHEKRGVRTAQGLLQDPHPAGWVQSHGPAARANILRCAACHDRGAKSNCVRCHATGGIDPHPPSWKWRNKSSAKINSKMCRICHTRAL